MEETKYRASLSQVALTKDSPYLSPDIYTPEQDRILFETVERCRICGENFLSRYGKILRCEEHEYLEPTKGPIKISKPSRNGAKLRDFKIEIMKKRGLYCECCKKRKAQELHHIKHFTNNPELAYDEDNVILLCCSCHDNEHPWRIEARESYIDQKRFINSIRGFR